MPRRVLRRLRGVLGIVLAAALLLSLGGLTLVSDQRSAATGDLVHRNDRLQLQTTLSGLTQQYLLLTFGELETLARMPGWDLTAGSGKDTLRLADFIAASPLISAGAAVIGPDGTPLALATKPGVSLPPATDPGYRPFRAALLAGRPGLSNLITAGNRTMLAFGIPLPKRGTLLVGYIDARTWPMESYVSHLQVGTQAKPYILDANGIVVAAPSTEEIGRRVSGLPTFTSGAAQIERYQSATGTQIATDGPVGIAGWQSINTQPAAAYAGSAGLRHTQTELGLLALLLVIGVVAISALYSRHRRLTAAAREALFDPVTGLAQRRLLTLRLEAALARAPRAGTRVGLIYGDLDGFKAVNDTHGHRRGDALLAEVARRLSAEVRAEDLVARFGGDEFLVVMEGISGREELVDLARRIGESIGSPVALDRATVTVGISLGGVLADGGSVETLIEAADRAMYDAKNGRGPVIRDLGARDLLPAGLPGAAGPWPMSR
ncbi:MAG TPA: GGDEF domain-containing protein [Mycobacteriales bacterium]|nr:GGDEF domain-containing protein [Mycobacteriales bacterium]